MQRKFQRIKTFTVLYVADLIAPHFLPVLSPVTFRMILTRQTFESPCMRQQQRYKPEDMRTDAAHGQRWKIYLVLNREHTALQSATICCGGKRIHNSFKIFGRQKVKC